MGPRREAEPGGSAYEDLCDEVGEEPGSVALAWLLHQDVVITANTPDGFRRRYAGRIA